MKKLQKCNVKINESSSEKETRICDFGEWLSQKTNFATEIVWKIITEKYTEYIQIWRNIGERIVKDHQRSHSVQPRMQTENGFVKMLEKAAEARAACWCYQAPSLPISLAGAAEPAAERSPLAETWSTSAFYRPCFLLTPAGYFLH